MIFPYEIMMMIYDDIISHYCTVIISHIYITPLPYIDHIYIPYISHIYPIYAIRNDENVRPWPK